MGFITAVIYSPLSKGRERVRQWERRRNSEMLKLAMSSMCLYCVFSPLFTDSMILKSNVEEKMYVNVSCKCTQNSLRADLSHVSIHMEYIWTPPPTVSSNKAWILEEVPAANMSSHRKKWFQNEWRPSMVLRSLNYNMPLFNMFTIQLLCRQNLVEDNLSNIPHRNCLSI